MLSFVMPSFVMQNNVEAENQEETMDVEESNETDGQSSGQRGLQAQVVIRQYISTYWSQAAIMLAHINVLASCSKGLMSMSVSMVDLYLSLIHI